MPYAHTRGSALRALRAAPLLAVILLAGCKQELYTGLDERDANQMVAVLLDNGLAAERRRQKGGDMAVYVEDSQFSRAVALLRSHELPKPAHVSLADVFKDEGLVSSPVAEKARMIYALSEELSRTLGEIDGVLSARVHIVLPNDVSLKAAATPSSASVFIRYNRAVPLPERLPQIKMLVVNSVQGLDYDTVSVAMFPVDVVEREAGSELTNIAGLWLHRESAGRASWLLVALAVAATVALLSPALAGLLFWRERRRKRAEGPVVEAPEPARTAARSSAGASAATGKGNVETLPNRRPAAEAVPARRPAASAA